MEAAEFVLDRAIVNTAKPETNRAEFTLRDVHKRIDRKKAEAEQKRKAGGIEQTETQRKQLEEKQKQG